MSKIKRWHRYIRVGEDVDTVHVTRIGMRLRSLAHVVRRSWRDSRR